MTYPGEMHSHNILILRPSKIKVGLILALCLAFTVGGGWMIHGHRRGGWFAAIVFGLGSLICALQLLPGSSYLLLEPDGFTVRTLYRSQKYGWAEVERFGVTRIGGNKTVAFDFSRRYERWRMGRQVAAGISGYEGMLPDTYGMKAEQLAGLLNAWKTRAGDAGRTT
jgi:hypothetical protein